MIFIVASEVKARSTSRACSMIHYLYMKLFLFPKPLNTNTRGSFLPFHIHMNPSNYPLQESSDETDGHQETTDLVGASSTGVCDGAVLGWVDGVSS
jgi:hypothetical protein